MIRTCKLGDLFCLCLIILYSSLPLVFNYISFFSVIFFSVNLILMWTSFFSRVNNLRYRASLVYLRLRPQHTSDRRRQDLLHVLRPSRHPTRPHHVPEHRREAQHLRDIPAETLQDLLQNEKHRSVADQPDYGWCEHVQHHRAVWCYRLLLLRGLEHYRRHILLFYNVDYNRLRWLCGASEGQSASGEARVCSVQSHIHIVRPYSSEWSNEPACATVSDDEHRGRTPRRSRGCCSCATGGSFRRWRHHCQRKCNDSSAGTSGVQWPDFGVFLFLLQYQRSLSASLLCDTLSGQDIPFASVSVDVWRG